MRIGVGTLHACVAVKRIESRKGTGVFFKPLGLLKGGGDDGEEDEEEDEGDNDDDDIRHPWKAHSML
jgi:hypothetical protein